VYENKNFSKKMGKGEGGKKRRKKNDPEAAVDSMTGR